MGSGLFHTAGAMGRDRAIPLSKQFGLTKINRKEEMFKLTPFPQKYKLVALRARLQRDPFCKVGPNAT